MKLEMFLNSHVSSENYYEIHIIKLSPLQRIIGIRSHNSALYIANVGAKEFDFKGGSGPCIFKLHGQIYTRTNGFRSESNTSP